STQSRGRSEYAADRQRRPLRRLGRRDAVAVGCQATPARSLAQCGGMTLWWRGEEKRKGPARVGNLTGPRREKNKIRSTSCLSLAGARGKRRGGKGAGLSQ